MSAFKSYASYYNLLYKDKDYKQEATYIHKLIRKYKPSVKSLLDIGCGTGKHDFEFENLGYDVTGIDLSADMISIATEQKEQLKSSVQFSCQDARNFVFDNQFDCIISLFHAMGYQTSTDDIFSSFQRVKKHLKPGGLFIFDCWYGPGVLSDPPVSRSKKFEDALLEIHRTSNSIISYNRNTVDVHFDISVRDNTENTTTKFHELHRVRYFFKPEIELLAGFFNMKLIGFYDWLKDEEPNEKSWYCVFVLENKD